MSVHSDTIPALAWAVVEKIADSDAGGWLMEFTARNVIRQRDALVAENQASEKLALYEHEQRLREPATTRRAGSVSQSGG